MKVTDEGGAADAQPGSLPGRSPGSDEAGATSDEGVNVEIIYDWTGQATNAPDVGDVLVTSTGTCYFIHGCRPVKPRTELPPFVTVRLRLTCEKMDGRDVPASDDRQRSWYELTWKPRGPK